MISLKNNKLPSEVSTGGAPFVRENVHHFEEAGRRDVFRVLLYSIRSGSCVVVGEVNEKGGGGVKEMVTTHANNCTFSQGK